MHDPEFLRIVEQQQGMFFEPSQPMDVNGDPIFYLDDSLLDINAILPGVLITRDLMVESRKGEAKWA